MSRITTFLTYESRAEEAAELYVSLFENSRIRGVTRYGDAGPAPKGSVMTVAFELDGREFVALNGGPHFRFTEAMSLSVRCDTQEEIDAYWEKLSDGGEPGPCGWLRDRFGLSWQITPSVLGQMLSDPDPERSRRTMQAMMGMKKIRIDDLKKAYDGVDADAAATAPVEHAVS